MSQSPPNTISDKQWTSLRRRRAKAQGHEPMFSDAAVKRRLAFRKQREERHSN